MKTQETVRILTPEERERIYGEHDTRCICGQPAVEFGYCEDCLQDLAQEHREETL